MNYYDSLLANIPGTFQTVLIGLESGTLYIAGSAPLALTNVIQENPVDFSEMTPSDGQVVQMDTLKTWPVSASPRPPLGSVLVSRSGTQWTILKVRFVEIARRWEVHCRNLSIVTDPTNPNLNRAWIMKANFGKGKANEARAEWKGYISGDTVPQPEDSLVARFQPASDISELDFSGEWVKESFVVTLQSQIPINFAGADWRLVDENGSRYRILQHLDAQRIDVLPRLLCNRITEGVEYFGQGQPQPLPPP